MESTQNLHQTSPNGNEVIRIETNDPLALGALILAGLTRPEPGRMIIRLLPPIGSRPKTPLNNNIAEVQR